MLGDRGQGHCVPRWDGDVTPPYLALFPVVLACQRHYDHDVAQLAKRVLSALSHNASVDALSAHLTQLTALLVTFPTALVYANVALPLYGRCSAVLCWLFGLLFQRTLI